MNKQQKIWFDDEYIYWQANDTIKKQSLRYYPLLQKATDAQRKKYIFSPFGIHWAAIDEDVSFESFDYNEEPAYNEISKIFKHFPEINVSRFAQRIGMNASLLAKYICGAKNPSPERVKYITEQLHAFAEELRAA